MKPIQMSCRQANQIDLVDYLEGLGHTPKKIRGNDYWYLSPLRQENTPSFKVDRKLNLWYDHGTGQGGTLIDLGIQLHHCTVSEFLNKLQNDPGKSFSFQPQKSSQGSLKNDIKLAASPIKIISTGSIDNPVLLNYLNERKIPLTIAQEYCSQVEFELYQKKMIAIGFKNDNGGYELRSPDFKGSNAPKEPKLVSNEGSKELAVFEGLFSFLSFKTLQQESLQKKSGLPNQQQDFLILNSLAFFEKSRDKMETYEQINLFLDRDKSGITATQKALQWSVNIKMAASFISSIKT